MATCKTCMGRQEGTKFCWIKERIMDLENESCSQYEHISKIESDFMARIEELESEQSEDCYCETYRTMAEDRD